MYKGSTHYNSDHCKPCELSVLQSRVCALFTEEVVLLQW